MDQIKTAVVVEDEEDILDLLTLNLVKAGFHVIPAMDGQSGLEKILENKPHVVLLDVMLPGMNGLEVLRRVKSDPSVSKTPVIMLSAKGDEADILKGLELGASDYIPKPFSPRVVVAKIKNIFQDMVILPSSEPSDDNLVTYGPIELDLGRFKASINGQGISLTSMEFKVLHYLLQRPGWVFSRYQIVESVKGEEYLVTDRTIDVLMVKLRKKLGDASHLIETVRGVGYKIKELNAAS